MTVKFLGNLNHTSNGDEYLKIKKFRGIFEAKRGFINFDNLFNGNRVLGETVNGFLNENFERVYREFSSPIFEILSNILRKVVENIFETIPFNEMFIM